jgi:hypothetical protein
MPNFLFILLIFVFTPLYLIENRPDSTDSTYFDKLSIQQDGIRVFNLSQDNIQKQIVQNKIIPEIERQVLELLPEDYVFLDYSYEISNSSLYTFHRDVTSSKTFQNLSYPSYTLIIYFSNGNHLSISEGSNTTCFITPTPTTIFGDIGQSILFDSDMVHAAALNTTTERYCKQYKICHKEDIDKLNHLNNQHIRKREQIQYITYFQKLLRLLSHKYIPLFDNKQIGKFIERKHNNYIVKLFSKIFKLDFFNNT